MLPTATTTPLPTNEIDDDSASVAAAFDPVARAHQIYPVLGARDIARVRAFGVARHYADGELIFEACRSSPGLVLILAGRIACTRVDGLGNHLQVAEFGPGQFSGEVAQLSGRPPLINGNAVGAVDALVIAPAALRALIIAEAELGETIMRALILRRVRLLGSNPAGPILIAPAGNAALFDLRHFLASNAHPFTVRDPADDADAAAIAGQHAPASADWPLVVCPDGSIRKNPSLAEIGRCLGMLPTLDDAAVYDIVVVGAGPAGLATAVYAASEGLSVLVLDQRSYGGQAGASARIENYLGFPTGISGRALAGRAYVQALKFGAEIAIPAPALRLDCSAAPLRLTLADGALVRARSIVLACGARYRRPAWPRLADYEGRGVYYWASPFEAKLCAGAEVILVGGGNSAGQAAVFLAGHAATVHMLVRGAGLAATMSTYLIERIGAAANIVLHTHSEISALDGDAEGLQQVRVQHRLTAESTVMKVRRVFLFLGAEPNTGWLDDCGVQCDAHGFVQTGSDAPGLSTSPRAALETSVPGVFAIGDVRANSTKRVAAAVGEGAAVVAQVHAYLAQREDAPAP